VSASHKCWTCLPGDVTPEIVLASTIVVDGVEQDPTVNSSPHRADIRERCRYE
jgi:hypothetical protein